MPISDSERQRLADVVDQHLQSSSSVNSLQALTSLVLEAASVTQADVAEALGVRPPSITRAKQEPDTRYEQLQMRIIEHLAAVAVEKQVRYVIRRAPSPSSPPEAGEEPGDGPSLSASGG